jgi:hypothetical protein
MLGRLLSVSEPLSANQVTAIVIVSVSVLSLLAFLMTTVITGSLQKALAIKHETALKRAMINQGMAAEAIVQVMNCRPSHEGAANLPCACEAVVNKDGEWQTGLVLQMSDDRYYVHYVGREMDENEWVDEDRIRFRPWSKNTDMITETRIGRNGLPRKQPMEMEV